MNLTQDVLLALAGGAGAPSSQGLQRNVIFPAIRPFDGEFGADGCDLRRLHPAIMPGAPRLSMSR
jgi:hypothetical protein